MPISASVHQSTKAVRIVKDNKSNDGWIARTREGKVCFIENLGRVIDKLSAGQVWQASIIGTTKTYHLINLEFKLNS